MKRLKPMQVQSTNEVGNPSKLMKKKSVYKAWVNQVSRVMRKPVFGVSDQDRHKLVCAVTEDGYRLEISDLESRGIVLYV